MIAPALDLKFSEAVILEWRKYEAFTPFPKTFPDMDLKRTIAKISTENGIGLSDWNLAFRRLIPLRGAMIVGKINLRSLAKSGRDGTLKIISLLEGRYDTWTETSAIQISLSEILGGSYPVDWLVPPLSVLSTFSKSQKEKYRQLIIENASWNIPWLSRFFFVSDPNIDGVLQNKFFKRMNGLIDDLAPDVISYIEKTKAA